MRRGPERLAFRPSSPARLSTGLLLLLAGCSALGSMSIHMLVPVMPAVAQDLGSSEATIQLTVTLYLICLGLGQLVVRVRRCALDGTDGFLGSFDSGLVLFPDRLGDGGVEPGPD